MNAQARASAATRDPTQRSARTTPSDQMATATPRFWTPKRVLLTRSARNLPAGREIAQRAAASGSEIVELKNDRLALGTSGDPRADYVLAKSTLAVVVASEARRRLQPIPPSADWRFDLAEGCPAHCQYCYLAGSLAGPPITRVYANAEEILDGLGAYLGKGAVTSASATRAAEGTTFECSCYTDPLGIEHLTGSLSRAVAFFGAWDADVQLRFTTKFGAVGPLIGLPHNRKTRVRMSVNAPALIRFEGGTDPLVVRLQALSRLARDGYRIGLTIAPIQPVDDWRSGYDELCMMVARELDGIADLDLTVELITHRFTPKSKGVLQGWYPGSKLEMDEGQRSRKPTKFGSVKHVYPAALMKEMRTEITAIISRRLPTARILYWT